MRIECVDYNSKCVSHCFMVTDDDLTWLNSVGAFCVYGGGKVRWYPTGFIGLVMQAV